MIPAHPDPSPGTPAPGRRTFRWVIPLAIINVIWLVVGLVLVSSGTMMAIYGMFVLPQTLLVISQPLTALAIAIIVTVAVVAVSVFTGAKTATIGYRVWAFGTLALTLSLLVGVLGVLTVTIL